MRVVQADGLNIQPVETDEFQIGVAETYDVIVEPKVAQSFAFVAESIDRSGQVVATLGPRPGMRAREPKLRAVPVLTMKDMGMDHTAMGHGQMAEPTAPSPQSIDHAAMGHMASGAGMSSHSGMNHGPDPHGPPVQIPRLEAKFDRAPGVANVAAMPVGRLDEPGIGLEDVAHRTLSYSQLRSLEPNPDIRKPGREVVVHLTSNMERYMWSFDGVKFSEVTESIKFMEGERLRLTLVNNTMMPHPIHLHGMFFDLVNGGGRHKPRKHTVVVKPGETLSADISAEHVGDWAFHCHLIYHMHAGMMQVVSVLPHSSRHSGMMHERMSKSGQGSHRQHGNHSAIPTSGHGGKN
jgi:CopA family copper-resistance protein